MSSPRADVVIPELLQGQWTTALICTYGADLTFFETRLLGQLAQIPLRIVLADDGQLAETLAESARTGQRHRLANKAYVAAPVRHPRAAHGKLIALLGHSSGLLVVGSGNLGYEGYAAPGELWHVYAYSDERPEHLQEFASARAHVDGLAQRGLLDSPVVELLQTAWGQSPWIPPAPASPSTLRSSLEDPIIDQLQVEVAGPVDELIAHAPFHDADCAALEALVERFQPKRTRLLLTDATSADPAAIQNVMRNALGPVIERVQVKSEPGAYIHAKWVHLIRGDSETLLSGSANLSRTALLRSAENGNVELGVITHGARGAFDSIYAHLERKEIHDPASLKITYRGAPPGETVEAQHPVLLWSRLDGPRLTLAFDRSISEGTAILVEDHTGSALEWTAKEVDGAQVRLVLTKDSAERLAEGGRIQVMLDGDDSQINHSWPYHLAQLRGRLDKVGQRDRLQHIGDLPEQDAELYELLQELDATLIIDRASVWRIAKGNEPTPVAANDEGEPSIRQSHYPKGTCAYCGRASHVSDRHACRLCLENARLEQGPARAPDLATASRDSQQLFFANMVFKRRVTPLPDYVRWDGRWSKRNKNQLPYQPGTSFDDDALEQLTLFDMDPDPEVLRQRLLVEDSDLTRYCAAIVADHARRYGWSVRQRNAVIQSLRLLQILRPTPTAKVRASDVVALRRYDGTITSTLDVLAEAGLLIEDVPTRVERYFDTKFIESGALPDAMREQLQLWLQIMLGGSRQAPRQLPREPETVELHIQGLAPVVQVWVEAGRQSFAEISTDDILVALASLPAGTSHRHFAENGLKSLFKILKGRRLVFANPTRGIDLTRVPSNLPLPLDPVLIRAELDSPNPAIALAVALVAFHGLTGKQVRELQLTDIVDGRLHIDGLDIPLAAPVRTRLSAWLDPHLASHREPAPAHQPTHRAAARPRRPVLPVEGRSRPPAGAARGPHPPRDPRHRRRRTPHLRPVRTQRRRRHPLPQDRRAPLPGERRAARQPAMTTPLANGRRQPTVAVTSARRG